MVSAFWYADEDQVACHMEKGKRALEYRAQVLQVVAVACDCRGNGGMGRSTPDTECLCGEESAPPPMASGRMSELKIKFLAQGS